MPGFYPGSVYVSMLDKIERFDGEYRFLSNFYMCPVTYEGIMYTCSEGAYVAQKTLDLNIRREISIMPHAGMIKITGRGIALRPDWDLIKLDIMAQVIEAKFDQNPDIRDKLLATGNAYLEEGNWWKDTYWGVCPVGSGNGQNMLGKLLMRLRDRYKGLQPA